MESRAGRLIGACRRIGQGWGVHGDDGLRCTGSGVFWHRHCPDATPARVPSGFRDCSAILPSRIPGAFALPSEQAGDGASRSRPPLGATHRAGNGVPPRVPRFSQAVMWTPSVEAHAPECAPVALPNGGFAMDEKKKDAGPERVGSWKAASPTGTSVGDRSDGSAASGFIAGRPRWETDDEADEEMDGATMDGGAITTGAAPIGAMPEEDDVSGAARTADFTRGTSGASGDASAHGASWAPSSAGDGARADAVREAIRDRESSGSGSEGFGLEETDAGDSATRTFAG